MTGRDEAERGVGVGVRGRMGVSELGGNLGLGTARTSFHDCTAVNSCTAENLLFIQDSRKFALEHHFIRDFRLGQVAQDLKVNSVNNALFKELCGRYLVYIVLCDRHLIKPQWPLCIGTLYDNFLSLLELPIKRNGFPAQCGWYS